MSKITVSLAGDTPAEISKLASELAGLLGGVKPAAAPAAAPKPAAAAPAAKPAAAPKPAAAAKPASDGPTLEQMRDLGRQLIKAGKKDDLTAAIKALGADSITTLDPSKYGELKTALDALLAPAEPAGDDAL